MVIVPEPNIEREKIIPKDFSNYSKAKANILKRRSEARFFETWLAGTIKLARQEKEEEVEVEEII